MSIHKTLVCNHLRKLEQLQLLNGFGIFNQFMPSEDLHHSELFVCHAHNPYMAFRWKDGFYPFYVNVCIFTTAAMTEVDAELEHLEAIGEDLFSETCIDLPVFFCFSRQVKKYEYPHDSVCIKSLIHYVNPASWRLVQFRI